METVDEEASHLEIGRTESDRLVVLALEGTVDVYSVYQLRLAIADRPVGAALVLDLRRLVSIDSNGVQVMVETHTAATRPPAWSFALVPGPPQVQHAFERAGIAQLLRFVADPADVRP